MKVLIACEESQIVTIEFRKLNIEAYSCDLQPCSGNHPEWHIQDNCLNYINNYDLIIAFPHLAGARWFKYKEKEQKEAIEFFMEFTKLKRVVIENPRSIMSTKYRKPDQIIQPYQFGHLEQKTTCLKLYHY